MTAFVPASFEVPERFDNAHFRLRLLRISDVVKDYDAVMTSVEHLQGVFGPRSSWPSPDLSFEQDLIDLGWHHKEFQKRTSFAYTVVKPDESQCLGCVYLYPCAVKPYDAEGYSWVRKSHLALDQVLFEVFKTWVKRDWPFKRAAFPGRDPSWEQWELMSSAG
jgi:hypothetical protein